MTQKNDNGQALQKTPAQAMNGLLSGKVMQDMINNTLKDKSSLFTASVLELYSNDSQLQKCDPGEVIREALKAASLDLPLNKNLGFAWIVARYSTKERRYIPQFQPGWKGIVQLAQRTAQYKVINTGIVYEGELKKCSKLTGEIDIEGEAVSDKAVGYFAHFELINGFRKSLYWSKEKVEAHVLKYNQESKKEGRIVGNWAEYFDDRSQSTVLKHLISKYGIMSVQMLSAMKGDEDTPEEAAGREIKGNANASVIGFTAQIVDDHADSVNKETGEVASTKEEPVATDGPGY